MIELIVEDGSIVPDANSYASVETIYNYAYMRGVNLAPVSPGSPPPSPEPLPYDPDKIAIMAINAMDYLEALKYQWKGERVSPSVQRLSWPRKNVYVDGVLLPSNEIPSDLVAAQCQLVMQINAGVSLLPTTGGGSQASAAFITREKIGPIETEYSEAVRLAAGSLPVMPAVDALLGALLLNTGYRLRTRRI